MKSNSLRVKGSKSQRVEESMSLINGFTLTLVNFLICLGGIIPSDIPSLLNLLTILSILTI